MLPDRSRIGVVYRRFCKSRAVLCSESTVAAIDASYGAAALTKAVFIGATCTIHSLLVP